jgi:hypothetical protein
LADQETAAPCEEQAGCGSGRVVGNAETILPNDDPNLASNCMKNGVLTKFKRAEPAGW